MNNKGFTVVELIASFALTMIISVFLFEVLIEVKDIFLETSLKSNIIEKMGIISKNIKLNVPKICSETDCPGLISFGDDFIMVNSQKFSIDKVSVSDYNNPTPECDDGNCYLNVSFKINSDLLAEPYEFKTVYYYKISEAVFLPGNDVNAKMKILAGNDISAGASSTANSNVTSIVHSQTKPGAENMTDANVVSVSKKTMPIYMWYDSGTIYWWSNDDTPSLNSDSSWMFMNFTNLKDISGLENFDTSNVTDLSRTFILTSLTNLDSLENWDTSNVTNMQQTFMRDLSLTDISGLSKWNTSNVVNMMALFCDDVSMTGLDGLENWNTSNVTNMYAMFSTNQSLIDEGYTPLLSNINALENWDTSKVKDMQQLFSYTSIITTDPIKRWDVSNVINMSYLFTGCYELKDITGLKSWDVSNVKNMSFLFASCLELTDISSLKNWITSNVTDMTAIFLSSKKLADLNGLENWNTSKVTKLNQAFGNTSITNLDALKSWDVSKVKNYSHSSTSINNTGTFSRCYSLTDASGINDWNIRKDADFTYMFNYTPVHPTFSKFSGSWDDQGTFTPN